MSTPMCSFMPHNSQETWRAHGHPKGSTEVAEGSVPDHVHCRLHVFKIVQLQLLFFSKQKRLFEKHVTKIIIAIRMLLACKITLTPVSIEISPKRIHNPVQHSAAMTLHRNHTPHSLYDSLPPRQHQPFHISIPTECS